MSNYMGVNLDSRHYSNSGPRVKYTHRAFIPKPAFKFKPGKGKAISFWEYVGRRDLPTQDQIADGLNRCLDDIETHNTLSPMQELSILQDNLRDVAPLSLCLRWLKPDGSPKSFRVTLKNGDKVWRTAYEHQISDVPTQYAHVNTSIDLDTQEWAASMVAGDEMLPDVTHDDFLDYLKDSLALHRKVSEMKSGIKTAQADWERIGAALERVSKELTERFY